ncbi:MAG: divalent-cation tolerance protein CutA [Deltaproteobacteria bacterium]|nr:divalent-cation tolerance protein CutA [Deltaproteobacteria bacterium]
MTAPTEVIAESIGKAMLTEKLIACMNISSGSRSLYVWEGKLCDETEVLCVMKTRLELFDKLKDRIIELHPYKVPEIIAIDIKVASEDYLDWVAEVTI